MKTNQKPSSNQMTPRRSDGKRFAIRGTTKTVIEVTTTEVDEEIPFRVEDTSGRLGQRTFDHYQDESTRDKKEKEVQNEEVKKEQVVEKEKKVVKKKKNKEKSKEEEDTKTKEAESERLKKEKESEEKKKAEEEKKSSENIGAYVYGNA